MGNLSSAVESVEYERHASEDIIATSASMQGFRLDMEDDHTIYLRLPKHPQHAFIGVYDGHSGKESSEWLANHLWEELDKLEEITNEGISEILLQMDIKWGELPERCCGSTIVFAIIERPTKILETFKVRIGWVGDSRAFAIKNGRLVELTKDHKPNNPEEKRRIELAGGLVSMDNRVDGELAMSRAFGDWNLKQHCSKEHYALNKVICIPEFQSIELAEGDCLLLSCDGLTEWLENKEIFDELVDLKEMHQNDADIVLDGLLQKALNSGSKDNMTSVLIELRHGAEFYKRDSTRMRTLRPGPFYDYMRDNQFSEAYVKNVHSMGLLDCPALREAAYLRDIKNAEKESKAENRYIPQFQHQEEKVVLKAIKDDADEAAKRTKYEKRKEAIEEAIKDLENRDFESTDKPEVASYSAFGDTEFLLKPTHEGYMAFLSKQEVSAEPDEKKMDVEETKLDLSS